MKTKQVVLTGVLGLAFAASAQANIITPPTSIPSKQNGGPANQDESTIVDWVNNHAGTSGYLVTGDTVSDVGRFTPPATPTAGSGFTITYNADKTAATVSWNLTGTGQELDALYVFGGDHANLYMVTADQEIVGSGTISSPLNNGGNIATISHIDLLGGPEEGTPGGPPLPPGEPGVRPSVPDGGTTVMLLGLAMGALGFVRRTG